jgi:very-short-patch-repair endonuclease
MATSLNARIEEWRNQLLDTSKRNRLISLNLGRAGAVKLVHPSANTVWTNLVADAKTMSFPLKRELLDVPLEDQEAGPEGTYPTLFEPETEFRSPGETIDIKRCLESPYLCDDHVLTDITDKQLRSRLGRLALNAKTSMTEQGVPTLYLAFGLLKWFESPDSQVQILSPLLLFPIEMERENVESPWNIKLQDEEVLPNYSLSQLMSNSFAIRFPDLPDAEDTDSADWRLRYFAAIQNAIRHLTNWEVLDECTLGIFSFQKIAMWDDLGKNQDHIVDHDLCRAVAGDQTGHLKASEKMPKAHELDGIAHPSVTYHILDADSSQHEAIEAVKRGANLVLDGPPGTGKSQTIANIIAEFLAMGKSVLFVSEKSAALEVVKRRLDKRGLGDFCLECHSHKSNKKQVIDELGRCLNLPAETCKDYADDLNRLFETRESLNAYSRALHQIRQPLGISAFQVHGQLAGIPTSGASSFTVRDVSHVTRDQLRKISELLGALPDCRGVIQNHTAHPWRGSKRQRDSLNLRTDIDHHFGRLALGLGQLRDVAAMLARLEFAPPEPSITEWFDAVELIKDAPSYPLVPAGWFKGNPRQTAKDFIQLDELTRSFRETRDALPEFSEAAVIRLEDDAMKTLRSPMDSADEGLLPHDHTTVHALRVHVEQVIGVSQELTQQIKVTNEALNRVFDVLGVTPRPLASDEIGVVLETLGLIGTVSPIRRSWLDSEKRQAIREVLDRTQNNLPEFSDIAVMRLLSESEGMAGLTRLGENGPPGVQSEGFATIVMLRDHLAGVAQSLRTLSKAHAETQSALLCVLAALGLTPRPLVRGLGKVQEILGLIGKVSPIRRSWLDAERRQVIRDFLEKTQEDLPEFSEVSVIRLVSDHEGFARLMKIGSINSSGPQTDGSATVITRRDKLESVTRSLRALSESHAETQSALLFVLAALGLTPRPLVIRGLGKVQELLELVGTASPIRRSWFDVERRREISKILERFREDEEKNTQGRLRLLERMSPIAFNDNYASLVSKCRSYRAVWRRVLPDWWILRSRLARLYIKEIPDVKVLMDDLGELTEYHSRREFGRQLKREYADHLILQTDGELDPERTIAGLQASERFDLLIRAFPDLKEILVDPARVDRDALTKGLAALKSSHRRFREATARASKHLDLGMVFNADGSLARMSMDEFARWLEEQIAGLAERLVDLNRLCLVLKPGSDILLAELPARLACIAALPLTKLCQLGDHFILQQDGEVDRELTSDGLRASEQFDPLLRAFPELKEILVDQSRIDRDALKTCLEGLGSRYNGFLDAVAKASVHYDLTSVINSDGSPARMSVDEFTKWLDEQVCVVVQRHADVNLLCRLLKPGCDVSLGDLPARLGLIADLRKANLWQLADHLVLREEGGIDRELTINGLRASERFDPLVRVLPELEEIIVQQPPVDQDVLRLRLEDLAQNNRLFREGLIAVERYIDLSVVLVANATPSTISMTDLGKSVEVWVNGFQARLDHLGRVSSLLQPTRDVYLTDLSARLQLFEALRQSAFKSRRLGTKLGLISQDHEIWDRDWREVSAKAEWTIRFLDKYANRPPEPLIRAATNFEIRDDMLEAVRRNIAVKSDEFMESWDFLTELFEPDREVSTGIQLAKASIPNLHDWVEQRRTDVHLIQEWVRFCELREQIMQADLELIFSNLLTGKLAIEDAKNVYLARFYRSWLDCVYENDPALGQFSTDNHERLIEKFRNLDRDAITRSSKRIREARLTDPARPSANVLDAPSSSELGTLEREVNKRKRHLPLRQLFARIPTVLLRLKPCLMMSPLAVSTYLNTKEIRFDLVIFDEASQVRPYDAISTIYRGRQLVVAGDQKQLPPTTFFDRTVLDAEVSSEEEEVEETLADFESILDVCCTLGLPRRRLRWHYRSRREPLIAFSNRHFYDNELVTFPSVLDTGQMPAIRFEYVPDGRWKAGASGGFNILEAKTTAKLVMTHFRTSPSVTLGVIAFSQRQQMAILDELERLRRMDSSLEHYFGDNQDEPFFVKNLENVQGDERDVIFLSIGYGPDENGRVSMRFGPLNRDGGERRLNVAVTRSRSAMTVITSMKSHDIDLSKTAAVGAKLLRAYLEFAERGITALGSEVTQLDEDDCDSPFEQQVAEALNQRGFEVRKQVGCSRYKIDLALVDPKNPGRFVLGIECDGATYHNSATARDRDRLREEVLESCGWRIVRIWSTDWVRNPNSQIDRVATAFERSLIETTANPSAAVTLRTVEPPDDEPPISTSRNGPRSFNTAKAHYDKIEDVPSSELSGLILSTLEKYGATEESALIVSVARQLGFQRTGAKIRARIGARVTDMLTMKTIARTDENGLKLNSDSSMTLG